MICLIMGVSGSGKSTIGLRLSQRLGWRFYDGDDFHPPNNLLKMSRGIPLNDQDRQPWLQSLQQLIDTIVEDNSNGVIACSALKESYRNLLTQHQQVFWVYLQGSYEQIWERMQQRQGHFMQPEMLRSQFDILEEPKNALIVSVTDNPEGIVTQIMTVLIAKGF